MPSLDSGNKEEPDFKMAYSDEKRSVGSSDADQFLLSSRENLKQETLSTGISIRDPENKSGVSKVFGTNDSSSKGQENEGSSGKRRHSRWDATPQADEQNVDDGFAMTKQRKTRWANDDSQLKMLGPIHLPDFVNDKTGAAVDPKVRKLKSQLRSVNRKLQCQESADELHRDAQLRDKLVNQKRHIVKKLIEKHPAFSKKVYLPVKEYPEYNFIRLILGHHGTTIRRMEKESGARLMLRGKGSTKRKDGKTKQKDEKPDPSDNEDLHVIIEADSQESFDAAMAMVERQLILVENGKNELEHSQLRGLSELNDTLSKTDGKCEICGDAGHYSVACPFSGKFMQTKAHENNLNFPAALGGGLLPFTSSPFPRKQPVDFRPTVESVPFGSDKLNRDVDYTSLFVAHLPQHVDVGSLVKLFSPFGALSYVQVIRDKATGLSKGYGFVKYTDPTSAAVAVNQMNGYRLDGNMLVVRVAGHQHGTPGCMQPVEHTSIRFPTAHPSTFDATHIPAPTCWPGAPRSLLPETYDLMHTSYGSLYTSPMPSSLTSTLNATSEQLAQFPGNPDNFASGYASLFS